MLSTTKEDFVVHIGNTLDLLQTLEPESVQTCVTSPPYFGLRNYGIDDQIGLESTPEEYLETLVQVFREVRRVLRSDGTLWVNIGDTYATGSGGSGTKSKKQKSNQGTNIAPRKPQRSGNLKIKDLIGIPWRLALALQADGWYLRSDIIWNKPNPMPESVLDRPTKAHEYIFLLSKSPKYIYDAKAIQELTVSDAEGRVYKNKRTVWTITPKSEGEHFAVFPPELPEICIKAGTSQYGCCSECGKSWDENGSTCKHKKPAAPSVVLDPFSGSGTTGIVAINLDRKYIGIELNAEYAALADKKFDKYSTKHFISKAVLDGLFD